MDAECGFAICPKPCAVLKGLGDASKRPTQVREREPLLSDKKVDSFAWSSTIVDLFTKLCAPTGFEHEDKRR